MQFVTFLFTITLIFTSASQAILIPLSTIYFHSLLFLLYSIVIELLIVFAIAYFVTNKFEFPRRWKIEVVSGIACGIMSIFKIYASDPDRTPPVIQSVLAGMTIVPTFFFSKLILQKEVYYDYRYIIASTIMLVISLLISSIPLFEHSKFDSFGWSIVYALGVVFRAIYSVLQELYFYQCQDDSLKNKISLGFYSLVIQLVTVLACFWVEPLFGNYHHSASRAFYKSFIDFVNFHPETFIFEAFIISYLIYYVASIQMNVISTNYTMITSIIVNPAVAFFFWIFPNLNNGINYPLSIILPSIAASLLSVILWFKGERNDYQEVKEIVINK